MTLPFLSNWNYGKRYCGIEFGSTPDGAAIISLLTAVKQKEEYEIEKTFSTDSFEKCAQNLQKNQHAFLCLTHHQVLVKQTKSRGPAITVVSSAFPNVDLNSFYYQIIVSNSGSIVALCRKEEVHRIIGSLENKDIRIIGFSLGFSSILNILPVLEKKEIHFSGYDLTFSGIEIISFEKHRENKEEANHRIGDSLVNSAFLLPLSGLFSYAGAKICSESNFNDTNEKLKKEHHQKVFFRKAIVSATGLLFAMLLINFLLFSNYYSQLHSLTGSYHLNISQNDEYHRKQQEVLQKEKTVEGLLKNSNSRSSFYLNRLVAHKPPSVLLSKFEYQPLVKEVKENEPIHVKPNLIQITGETENEAEFSRWIKELEQGSLIAEVRISDFKYSAPGTSEFVLILMLAADETIK